MRTITPVERVGIVLGGTVVLYLLYGLSGIHTAAATLPPHSLRTPLDDLIPFVPATTFIYLGLVPQVVTPALLVEDWRVMWRGALGLVAMISLFLVVWLSYPVSVPRPPVPVDGLFTWGVALTRFIDPPTNCFPSAHVADSVYAALFVRRVDRKVGNLLLVTAGLIALSTLTLGQHWILDGVVGALAAVFFDWLFFSVRPPPAEALRAGPRRRLWWAAALHLALFLAAALPWWLGLVDPATLNPLWARH